MTTIFQDPDYKNNFFECSELTKIENEPDLKSLITLRNQVKANAMTVHTTLGGGTYGHLGLVLAPEQYAQIPNTVPYERPAHPGPVVIDNTLTQYQIAARREQHQERLRLFREVTSVERVLIQQIVAAVDPKYLRALRSATTHQINKTIPEIFMHLFETYGDLTTEDLMTFRIRLEGLRYPANEPVDTIFTEVENYQELCEMAESPLSDKQTIDYGYMLITKTLKYKSTLKAWNALPAAEKTWNNFKNVFRKSQKAMRKTGELNSPDGLNHTELVNVVSEGVKQGIFEATPPTNEINMVEQANSVNGQTMFHTVNDHSQLTTQLETMSERMNQMQQMLLAPQQQQQQNQNTHAHQQHSFQNPYGWNPYMTSFPPAYPTQNPFQPGPVSHGIPHLWNQHNNQRPNGNRRFSKYCWTHGGCGHRGPGCKNKAEGHNDKATFANKMGGSTKNCWN